MLRGHVGFAHREARRGRAAVAIRAAEHNVRRSVHVLNPRVAFDAAGTFHVRFLTGLVDQVTRLKRGHWGLARDCNRRAIHRVDGLTAITHIELTKHDQRAAGDTPERHDDKTAPEPIEFLE